MNYEEGGVSPDLCIVGEPTGMEVGLAHKGNRTYRLAFTGEAAHSSRAPAVVNAAAYAARFVSAVTEEAAGFATAGPFQDGFDVPHTTVHVGVMNGGTQVNIVPDLCVVDMEIRYLPGEDADALAGRFVFGPAGKLNDEMAARGAGCGVTVADVYSYPAFPHAGGRPGRSAGEALRRQERRREALVRDGSGLLHPGDEHTRDRLRPRRYRAGPQAGRVRHRGAARRIAAIHPLLRRSDMPLRNGPRPRSGSVIPAQ